MSDDLETEPCRIAREFIPPWVHDNERLKWCNDLEKRIRLYGNRRVETLLEYARHAATCPMPARQCDCGLDEVLKRTDPM
jgi:hypothetical protein